MTLTIYDSLRRKKLPFDPIEPGRVGMYVCGMTVQGPPHVGHMRSFFMADVMRRIFRARGYDVKLVQNFTDVDDKIIEKANDEGIPFEELANRHIRMYYEASDWFGIERADEYPRATEHIAEILELISDLVDKGYAYASGGDVFYDVTKRADYGKLSGKKIEDLRSGVRIEVDEDKRHPVDFALWKAAKPGEPSWDSPWGPGRPGWHIECSAMAMKHLGATLDLHGGGRDLIFPHHENELAQSEASTDAPFCNYWVESGMVNLGGQKMSKSTGIFFAMKDVMHEIDAESLRIYLLSTHYRSPIEYSKERLTEAKAALARLRNFLTVAARTGEDGDAPPAEDLEGLDAEFRETIERSFREAHEALDDDFNTAGSLGKLFELVRAGNGYIKEGETSPAQGRLLAEARRRILDVTRILGFSLEEAGGEPEVPADVLEWVRQREQARERRDWAEADRLRDRIKTSGFVVEDRPDGSLVKAAGSAKGTTAPSDG